MKLKQKISLVGEVSIPGDKSISHRAIMFGAISKGETVIDNFLQGADCLSTIDCFQKLGVTIKNNKSQIIVHGNGMYGLKESVSELDVGNSGTTTRLISGILAGQSFSTQLNGDESIQKRPMKRILDPLAEMGANIKSLRRNNCTPLKYSPANLTGIMYHSPVASAQVKSCILLAGLYANGSTTVTEPILSRNHSELMLKAFGANISTTDKSTTITPGAVLTGQKIFVPGDISSAAFFIAAALITKGSKVLIKNVGINPTRDGILKVAKAMGANIVQLNPRLCSNELVCDLFVTSSELKATCIGGDIIPTLIDEIPAIAVMAAFAKGTTIIKDAKELAVKETNRIETITYNLQQMGISVTPTDDGMIIKGGNPIQKADFDSFLDHRIAMAFTIAALNLAPGSTLKNAECVDISYPNFFQDLYQLNDLSQIN